MESERARRERERQQAQDTQWLLWVLTGLFFLAIALGVL